MIYLAMITNPEATPGQAPVTQCANVLAGILWLGLEVSTSRVPPKMGDGFLMKATIGNPSLNQRTAGY